MAEGIFEGLQSSFLQIDITQVVIHEADQPDAIVDFLDAHGLARERLAQIDFLAIETEAAATGDHDGPVVKRVVRFRDTGIGPGGSDIDLGRAFHSKSLVRAFGVEFFNEGVEFSLLLKNVGAGGTRGLLFQGQVHPFMPAVLLRMTGLNALDRDAQPQPPD